MWQRGAGLARRPFLASNATATAAFVAHMVPLHLVGLDSVSGEGCDVEAVACPYPPQELQEDKQRLEGNSVS